MHIEFPRSALESAAHAAALAARPVGVGNVGSEVLPREVGSAGSGSFGDLLLDALRSVNQTQSVAEGQQRSFELGGNDATLESTMLAMQKAQIGFQSAVTVRNRLVQAYTDIMGMQV
ncbi:MAG: flagellar hook-basal body complex protein FliE [Lautropia sp.]|nr:flagellar hook-basal body complex protein FliE [Lautropia sp.]